MNMLAHNTESKNEDAELYKRAYEREKQARKEAELLLESKSSSLYKLNVELEQQCKQLENRSTELEFLHELALISDKNFSFKSVLQNFIDAMCQRSDWLFGHVYTPVKNNPSQLEVSGILSSSNYDKAEIFYSIIKDMKFSLGERLPGRVYQSQKSEWIDNVHHDLHNPRINIYTKFNISSAFAIPIKAAGRIVAVCEFFTDQLEEKNIDKIKFSEITALQIGYAIDKYHAQKKIIREREKLTKVNSRIQYLIDNTPAIIYTSVASGDFKITSISANIENMLGYKKEDVLDDQDFWFNHIHEEDRSHVFMELPKLWQNGEQVHEYRFQKKDGEYLWMHDTLRLVKNKDGTPLEIIGSLVDVTSHKELEAELKKEKDEQTELINTLKETKSQLVQSEKMASLGQLAAGVAHEINNPVGFVMSNLGSLKQYVEIFNTLISKYEVIKAANDDKSDNVNKVILEIEKIRQDEDIEFITDDCYQLISESIEGTERVKDIVHQLKCFSHVDQAEIKEANINDCIENTLKVVWNELKYKAKIIKEFDDLPLIKCNSAELNQVFMNLLVNAGHAIEDQGAITINTKLIDENIKIKITDTGQGIAEENLTKLFNPFFTTKPVGEGTGLGLSISYGIIEKHGGTINVESELGKGTSFIITLPISSNTKEIEQ